MRDLTEEHADRVSLAAQALEHRLAEIAEAQSSTMAAAHRALTEALQQTMLASQQALAGYQMALSDADATLAAAMALRTREFFGEPAAPLPRSESDIEGLVNAAIEEAAAALPDAGGEALASEERAAA